jgi:hypothetical protein
MFPAGQGESASPHWSYWQQPDGVYRDLSDEILPA